ncbi:Diphthine methyltransferase [Coccomyxa sp. Obi]|nr:Diphthine methyltransferase [Coccomyxa sp. Obi]
MHKRHGIFELKWEPNPSAAAPWLALALTDGTLALLQLGEDNEAVRKGSVDVDSAALSTCVAFQPPAATPDKVLGVSTSNGFLATIKVDGSRAVVLEKWLAHDLEIWACAFDCWQENLLFSGADDAFLKAWDIRAPTRAPVFQNRKEHGAGVCCIQPSKQNEYVLCTGSYDEFIRLWDTRNPSRPLITAKAGTGGGVWRVNWHPCDGSLLLAACMHNGCAVFRADVAAGSLQAVARYEGHSSIAYGADWFSGTDAKDQHIVASCSFYDNLVHVWSCQLP